MIRQILERLVEANRLPTRITATTDRRRAVEGAHYVINCARIGGLEAYRHDIEIPLQYGVDQCVGDTICAGGILYGQRNIPVILDFCRDIREVAAPGARFLNYANPMAMNTWAAIDYGKVDTDRPVPRHPAWRRTDRSRARRRRSERARIRLLRHQPPDLVRRHPLPRPPGREGRADRRFRAAPGLFEAGEGPDRRSEALRLLLDRSRTATCPNTCPGTASGRSEITRWIDMSDWIHGETGGYLRHSTETRNWFETDYPALTWRKPAGRSTRMPAPRSMPAISSRRLRPAGPIAATSTSETTA